MKMIKELNKAYWLYWFASSASMAASNILQYILSLYVLDITGSGTLFASMLSIIIFPRLLLTPLAGVIADRVKKIKVMSWILLFESTVLAIYCVLGNFVSVKLGLIYLLVIILEAGEIFYGGLSAAVLPDLVEKEKLKDAIAFSKMDDGIVVVIAPMAAALIYSEISIAWAFGIIAALNFISFILQRLIHPEYESKKIIENKKSGYFKDFMDGLRFIKEDRLLKAFIILLPVTSAFFGATFSVSVMYLLRRTYNLSTYAYGLYNSITASMSLIIPLLAVPVVRKYPPHKLFITATALIAAEIAAIGCFAFAGVNGAIPVMVSVAAITIFDCMTIACAIPMQMSASIILQTGVKKEMLGRVSSTISLVSTVFVALGELMFGVLNDVTTVWFPIFLGAAGVGVSSFIYKRTKSSH